mmetsp:Transcript_6087/g.14239  ORF Transcript_6087/g.14239 Transcript_6087/m.14239 type:complete len:266 (-) Transcript_6087:65-862(-)
MPLSVSLLLLLLLPLPQGSSNAFHWSRGSSPTSADRFPWYGETRIWAMGTRQLSLLVFRGACVAAAVAATVVVVVVLLLLLLLFFFLGSSPLNRNEVVCGCSRLFLPTAPAAPSSRVVALAGTSPPSPSPWSRPPGFVVAVAPVPSSEEAGTAAAGAPRGSPVLSPRSLSLSLSLPALPLLRLLLPDACLPAGMSPRCRRMRSKLSLIFWSMFDRRKTFVKQNEFPSFRRTRNRGFAAWLPALPLLLPLLLLLLLRWWNDSSCLR